MDLPPKTPYEIKMNGEPFWVLDKPSSRLEYLAAHPEMLPERLGLIALGTFRINSYVDYIAIAEVNDEEETETWCRIHEQYEMLDWFAGTVYRGGNRQKQLVNTERSLGRFILTHGWSPDYVLEDRPSDYEMESYIQHVVAKDEVDGELRFRSENEQED